MEFYRSYFIEARNIARVTRVFFISRSSPSSAKAIGATLIYNSLRYSRRGINKLKPLLLLLLSRQFGYSGLEGFRQFSGAFVSDCAWWNKARLSFPLSSTSPRSFYRLSPPFSSFQTPSDTQARDNVLFTSAYGTFHPSLSPSFSLPLIPRSIRGDGNRALSFF